VKRKTPLPKVGDRVLIDGHGQHYFVVIAVNKETATVNVIPEDEVYKPPLERISQVSIQ
jgi:hypothetical protein